MASPPARQPSTAGQKYRRLKKNVIERKSHAIRNAAEKMSRPRRTDSGRSDGDVATYHETTMLPATARSMRMPKMRLSERTVLR